MGATTIVRRGRGKNMNDAFRRLQDEARSEYGYDGYNGEINNCRLAGDKTREYNASKDKNKFQEELLDRVGKRDAYGICLKEPKLNTNRIKSTVEVNPQKGTRVWETVYVATTRYGERELIANKSQKLVITKAREHAEKTQETVEIIIEKRLKKGVKNVASVRYKNSSNEQEGEYIFLACAPE